MRIQPVPTGTSSTRIQDLFSSYGEIGSVIINPGNSGEPNHAYVNFTTPQAAQNAAAIQMVEMDSQWCQVYPRSLPPRTHTLRPECAASMSPSMRFSRHVLCHFLE